MPNRKALEGNIIDVERALKQCKNCGEYRRIQCVHLALLHPDMTAKEIAEITLYSKNHVLIILADYRKNGLDGLTDMRGGRHRENMTLAQEQELLAPFEKESQKGSLVVATEIKRAYENKIGRKVAESTIYRMLGRHGFRKITPYRRHKKADKEAQETFKKTSRI
jgi:transposase